MPSRQFIPDVKGIAHIFIYLTNKTHITTVTNNQLRYASNAQTTKPFIGLIYLKFTKNSTNL